MIRRISVGLQISHREAVKTVNFANARYLGCPVNISKIFSDQGAQELVVMDINSNLTSPDFAVLAKIAGSVNCPLAYGGAISSINQALSLVNMGFERFVLQAMLFHQPEFLAQLSRLLGAQSVVASIDVIRGADGTLRVWDARKSRERAESFGSILQRAKVSLSGEILLGLVHCDGLEQGTDAEAVAEAVKHSAMPIAVRGGIRTAADIEEVEKAGAVAAVLGSIVSYSGRSQAVVPHLFGVAD